MNLESLSYLNSTYLLEESTSSFIYEGDGFTGERKEVRWLLNLVAHASGYKIMVGAHNTVGAYNTIDVTVECQMHVGGCVAFFRNGRRRYL